ncbi:MAG: rod shape-determining protein RodA [Clostridia bacterium]|nr:rod shape-determining protein RodA [Clostridia bacterium]
MNFWKIVKSREFRIVVLILVIVAIGTIALASAAYSTDPNYSTIKKQGVAFVLGMIGMIIAASIDYEMYSKYWYLFYVPCLILLVLVLFTEPINHARSWFRFFDGKIAFQPSEIAKIVLIITTAHFLVKMKRTSMSSKNRAIQILLVGLLIGVPVFLILLQPDFGTGMVFVAAVLAMLFVWGIDYKLIKYGILGTLILAPVTYFFFLKPGQKQRILVFLNPNLDPTGSGYHVLQSKLAVGAGQLGGMGLYNGTQTQMDYLFAKTTDFIFASIAEEMGFIVATLLIVLLLALVIHFYGVAKDARDEEGRLIAIGIGTMFAFHIFINVGMTMGLAPITGIPLPFVSSGGSSMLTNMIAAGIVLGISFRKTGLRF